MAGGAENSEPDQGEPAPRCLLTSGLQGLLIPGNLSVCAHSGAPVTLPLEHPASCPHPRT